MYTTDGGTAITGNTLTVYKSGANTPGILELAGNSNVENQYVGAISFLNNENSNSGGYERKNIATITAQLRTANSNSGNNSGGDLVFWTKANVGSNYERLRLTHDGRGLSQFTAKAWINYEQVGTQTITDSHNVGSVTDVSAGVGVINFANNVGNTGYSISVNSTVGATYTSVSDSINSQTTGSYRVEHRENSGAQDADRMYSIVFGD